MELGCDTCSISLNWRFFPPFPCPNFLLEARCDVPARRTLVGAGKHSLSLRLGLNLLVIFSSDGKDHIDKNSVLWHISNDYFSFPSVGSMKDFFSLLCRTSSGETHECLVASLQMPPPRAVCSEPQVACRYTLNVPASELVFEEIFALLSCDSLYRQFQF